MLPDSIPCFKAFYLGADGALYTRHSERRVRLGETLSCHGSGPVRISENGIHFCVTLDDCMTYYKQETRKGRKRVVAIVSPSLDDYVYDGVNKYCARSVRVVAVLPHQETRRKRQFCDLYRIMMLAGCPADADNNILVRWAARYADAATMRSILLEGSVDPKSCQDYPVRIAAKHGNTGALTELLRHARVDPTACENFALRWAARNGHADTLQILLRDGRCDPFACRNEALRMACVGGHREAVKLLLWYMPTDTDESLRRISRKTIGCGHRRFKQLLGGKYKPRCVYEHAASAGRYTGMPLRKRPRDWR